jgi:hypothetical protein
LDLKSYSLWAKMSAIYPFVGGTATNHKYNLKDPRDLDVAFRLQFNGGWTHNTNGITGNGSNAYADTFVQLNSVALPGDSSHFSTYNRVLSSNLGYNGLIDGLSLFGWGGRSGGSWQVGFNGFNNTGVACDTGFLIGSVNPSGSSRLYRNGSNIYSVAPGFVTNTYKFYLGALNIDGGGPSNYSSTNFALWSLGLNLSITDAANFNTAVQAFQTTLGRQV